MKPVLITVFSFRLPAEISQPFDCAIRGIVDTRRWDVGSVGDEGEGELFSVLRPYVPGEGPHTCHGSRLGVRVSLGTGAFHSIA